MRGHYTHPIERLHTLNNVLNWFDKNDIHVGDLVDIKKLLIK